MMLVRQEMTLGQELDALEAAGRKRTNSRKATKAAGPVVPTERQVHQSIVAMVRSRFPQAIIQAIQNETGQAHTNGAAYGAARRRSGINGGFPDLLTLWPGGRAVLIEVKRPGGRVRENQTDMLDRMEAMGFVADIATSQEEAEAIFRRAGVVR